MLDRARFAWLASSQVGSRVEFSRWSRSQVGLRVVSVRSSARSAVRLVLVSSFGAQNKRAIVSSTAAAAAAHWPIIGRRRHRLETPPTRSCATTRTQQPRRPPSSSSPCPSSALRSPPTTARPKSSGYGRLWRLALGQLPDREAPDDARRSDRSSCPIAHGSRRKPAASGALL